MAKYEENSWASDWQEFGRGPKESEGSDICPRNLIRAMSPMQEFANMQLLPL